MVTEEDYRYIVDDVYDVDSGKVSNPIQEGRLVANDRFKVISKPIDNTSNGMQTMAVAPVDKSGNVDYSHVVIAYAGTNRSDINDIEMDLQSLGLGRDKLQLRSSLNSAKVVVSQFVTALNYANVN